MAENQQDYERLLTLVRQLVAKCLVDPAPDLRGEVSELYEALIQLGCDMDAAMCKARSQFQEKFLPPREFFTAVCDKVEAALDHLREHSSVPDEIVDDVYDCVVKGDLTRLMREQHLLKVLLIAMRVGNRTAWEAEWFLQFVIGMNVYRLALKKGPIPAGENTGEEEEEETAADGEWEFGDPLSFGE